MCEVSTVTSNLPRSAAIRLCRTRICATASQYSISAAFCRAASLPRSLYSRLATRPHSTPLRIASIDRAPCSGRSDLPVRLLAWGVPSIRVQPDGSIYYRLASQCSLPSHHTTRYIPLSRMVLFFLFALFTSVVLSAPPSACNMYAVCCMPITPSVPLNSLPSSSIMSPAGHALYCVDRFISSLSVSLPVRLPFPVLRQRSERCQPGKVPICSSHGL